MRNNYLKTIIVLALLFISNLTFSQTTLFVDATRPDNSSAGTSWNTAKRDLQAAINSAVSGDQIWVKAGIYLPTQDPYGNSSPANNRDKTFLLKSGVKIYGGFSGTETLLNQRNWIVNTTILSGDLGTPNVLTDNAYHVVLSVNLNNTTLLDGVTITKGYGTAPGNSTINVGGRTIERYHGGGIFNSHSATSFSNCTVSFNSADCTDTDNDAVGAGVNNFISTSTFTNCIIDNNSFLIGGASFGVFGAGMAINGGNCSIIKCVFSNNSSGSGFLDASRGGALYIGSTATIENSVFYNNSSQNGAAFSFGGGGFNLSTITNCTITNNTSSFAGTGYQGFSKATFRNSIFWNNPPTSSNVSGRNEIYSNETNTVNQPTFINCIIRDALGSPLAITNTNVTNCITSNPLFNNSSDGNGVDNLWGTVDDGLMIQSSSPARNFGISGSGVPTTDITGNSRDNQPDLGAYEFQNPCVVPTVYNVSGGGVYCLGGDGLAVTLSDSEVGVSYQLKNNGNNIGLPINGTGNALNFGNQTTAGTYSVTATRTVGGCLSTMNGTASITVNPNITPTFTAVSPICSGETLSALPTTSTNGITGSWSPALNNSTTTEYTFTPSTGQCASTTTLIITVNPNITPIFSAVSPICSG
ncbi:choice-of-anchor Q domain-containing protein, partial [uncultured Flavobacterium sp.]|uniref:choice-of-anchor Q domain-containing protein n=1 Tax=uncultured Flavobacterium sp. TaxID=165435 RepID=UPI00262FFEB2